jgi:hypothetical protein
MGCTEIELLVTPDDVDGLHFPTTRVWMPSRLSTRLSRALRDACAVPRR